MHCRRFAELALCAGLRGASSHHIRAIRIPAFAGRWNRKQASRRSRCSSLLLGLLAVPYAAGGETTSSGVLFALHQLMRRGQRITCQTDLQHHEQNHPDDILNASHWPGTPHESGAGRWVR